MSSDSLDWQGTEQERYNDLRWRGYGEDRILVWQKYYRELNFTVPESASIGFTGLTENSVTVFWTPHSDGGSPITGYRLVIKNQDTGQTITELNPSYNTTTTLIQNLDSGTNYRAYVIVINKIGNSFEQSNNFKTLGTIIQKLKYNLKTYNLTLIEIFQDYLRKLKGQLHTQDRNQHPNQHFVLMFIPLEIADLFTQLLILKLQPLKLRN